MLVDVLVAVGVLVAVEVLVGVAVRVGVRVAVIVGVEVDVGVAVLVRVEVAVAVGVGVGQSGVPLTSKLTQPASTISSERSIEKPFLPSTCIVIAPTLVKSAAPLGPVVVRLANGNPIFLLMKA